MAAPLTPEDANSLLRATLDALYVGTVADDLNRRIVRWNRRFLEMFGLTVGQLALVERVRPLAAAHQRLDASLAVDRIDVELARPDHEIHVRGAAVVARR